MLLHRHPLSLLRERLRQRRSIALAEIDPALAQELQTALFAKGEDALAGAAAELRVSEPCPCADSACASFYAVDRFRAAWTWGREGRTINLRPNLSVDVLGERIIAVEIHERPSLKLALTQLDPARNQRR